MIKVVGLRFQGAGVVADAQDLGYHVASDSVRGSHDQYGFTHSSDPLGSGLFDTVPSSRRFSVRNWESWSAI